MKQAIQLLFINTNTPVFYAVALLFAVLFALCIWGLLWVLSPVKKEKTEVVKAEVDPDIVEVAILSAYLMV